MRYRVLCTDYDGTLADEGRVSAATFGALERLKRSGRRLVLVTGRVLREITALCPDLSLFDAVVAENGALLYDPASGRETLLAQAPPPRFAAALRARGVRPLECGRVIVATREPHQSAALETIRSLGLELEVLFNKGAVMVLPAGITKASGLASALSALHIEPRQAVGVGDAENDHSLLRSCGCGVAVANAVESLKQSADWVTRAASGAGVAELIDALLAGALPEPKPATPGAPPAPRSGPPYPHTRSQAP